MTVEDEEADLDRAFELVANRRRRAVIEVLRTTPRGSLEVATLVEAVATVSDVDDLTSSLSQRHLPKLDAAGVVDYDEEAGVVEYDSDPLVERCLDVAELYRSDQWMRRSSDSV
ncbi:DUF7344 domain-containing protein [Halosimplex salinum]|uniref:DUF7344 domain-containing protein n=1 Tax=Halosimplex salinum TaxID=1710538 RepID=UPI000F464DFF|nr:hypothetical protein [Halosimplex salinum]